MTQPPHHPPPGPFSPHPSDGSQTNPGQPAQQGPPMQPQPTSNQQTYPQQGGNQSAYAQSTSDQQGFAQGAYGEQPARRDNRVPIMIIAGIALAGLAVALIVGLSGGSSAKPADYGLASSSEDKAPNVSQLAADAAKAADDVDLEAGLALMCSPPPSSDVTELKDLILKADKRAGGKAKKSLTITTVSENGDSGSFVILVKGEGALAKQGLRATAQAAKINDKWCISDYGISQADG